MGQRDGISAERTVLYLDDTGVCVFRLINLYTPKGGVVSLHVNFF